MSETMRPRGADASAAPSPGRDCADFATMILLGRFHDGAVRQRIGSVLVDALFDFRTEVPDQTLDRPGSRIAERADSMPFDLLRHLEQHVDLALLGVAPGHALHDAPHPAGR